MTVKGITSSHCRESISWPRNVALNRDSDLSRGNFLANRVRGQRSQQLISATLAMCMIEQVNLPIFEGGAHFRGCFFDLYQAFPSDVDP